MNQIKFEPDYINFDIAKLLKSDGFNISVSGLFFDGVFKNIFPKLACNTDFASTRYNSAPEISIVRDYLFNKYGVWIYTAPENNDDDIIKWYCTIQKVDSEVRFVKRISELDSSKDAYLKAFEYILNKK